MSADLERRLESAFSAYAELADDSARPLVTSAPIPGWWVRWRAPLAVAAATVATVATVTLAVGFGQSDGTRNGSPAAPPTSPAPSPTGPEVSPSPAAIGISPFPFELHTHCGVDEANINGVWFDAERPHVTEFGPPDGWGDPSQLGTMTMVSPTEAVFRDDAGHEVWFRARPGATGPKALCE